jgi:hypothetical protein
MFVAVSRRQPRAFLGDQKTRLIAGADDVESHHLGQFVGDAIGPVIFETGQGPALVERPQPRIQEIALFHRPDNRGAGAFEFHPDFHLEFLARISWP